MASRSIVHDSICVIVVSIVDWIKVLINLPYNLGIIQIYGDILVIIAISLVQVDFIIIKFPLIVPSCVEVFKCIIFLRMLVLVLAAKMMFILYLLALINTTL